MSKRILRLAIGAVLAMATGPAMYAHVAAVNREVYAIRYGTLVNFAVGDLVAGANPSRRMHGAFVVWLIKRSDGRVVLVDAALVEQLESLSPVGHRAPGLAAWHRPG